MQFQTMIQDLSLSPLECLLGLLVLVGIALFVVTCWRNVRHRN